MARKRLPNCAFLWWSQSLGRMQALARAAIGDFKIRIYKHQTRPWRDSGIMAQTHQAHG
jgi:hypothetical protein